MRRRGLHRVTGTAVLLAVLALLTSVSTASADVVHLKIKEGRTRPGSWLQHRDRRPERDRHQPVHLAAHP